MKKGKLFTLVLLASSLMLSACELSFLDDNTQQQTATLQSIAVSKQPNKLVYEINDQLDTTGLEVTATYDDKTTKDVTSNAVIGSVDMSLAGKKNVNISYSESGISLYTSFNITVNAAKVYCTVTFDSNGGTGSMDPLQIEKNQTFTLPECTFIAPENKSFKAWQIGVSEFAVGTDVLVNNDMTIKAVWQNNGVAPVTTYTVSFDSNGGTGSMNSETVNEGATYTLPQCGFTAPSNKTFKAWQVGTDTTERAVGYSFAVNSNVTIKALWQNSSAPITQYTVTFDKNGGTGTMSSITVNAGTTITLPNNEFTAPSGKVFDGWSISNVKYAAGSSYVVNNNVTAKAQWITNPNAEFTVTFSANGGTGTMPSQTVKSGTVITLPANGFTAPSNKQFKNWLIGSTQFNVGATYTVNSDITVKANWEYIKRTITFDSNGGSGTMSAVQVNSGSSYTLPSCTFTAPTSKTFKAWQINSNEYNAGATITVNTDLTVTALWKDKPAQAKWTLMFYICGSNLESGKDEDRWGNVTYNTSFPRYGGYATEDIKEILTSTNQPDDVNIIFETGGAGQWNSRYNIPSNKLSRYYADKGNLREDPTNSSLEDLSMGASSTFQAFLEWGIEKYPAEKYGVFMWNHGGAMDGCCFDENHQSNGYDDGLTINEFDTAVQNAKTNKNNGNNLEFVAYDACLMAVQDIAEKNSHHFNYMLCSQESESGYGYDYDAWMPDFYNNYSTITTKALLESIGQTFMVEEKTLYGSDPFDQTQSALDLSKMAAYKTAFEDVANSLKSSVTSDNWETFTNNCIYNNSVQKYGYYDEYDEYVYDIYDAEDVLNCISKKYTSLSSKATTAKNALSNLVFYHEEGEATSGCGLNVFCPVTRYNYYYKSETNFTNWWTVCSASGLTQNS